MSYDITFQANLGNGFIELSDFEWNYTSNVAPMWRKAMWETNGLAGLAWKRAEEAAHFLTAGISRMENNPDAYRELNPPNGWGDFDHQLQELKRLLEMCQAVPKAIVRVDR